MKPILIEYAGITISAYSFMMAVGASLLFFRAVRDAKTFHLDRRLILWVLILAWVAGWAGARIVFVVEHRDLLPAPWWTSFFSPTFGGFASYGGVLGGAAAAALGAWLTRLPVLKALDSGSVGMCMFGIAARIGCFLAGCCHGSPVAWGVVFPAGSPAALHYGESVAVHPSQLYEAAALAVIAVVLWRRAPGMPGERFCWLMLSYASVRLLLDLFRGDALVPHGALSPAQWISFGVLAVAACLLTLVRRYQWRTAV